MQGSDLTEYLVKNKPKREKGRISRTSEEGLCEQVKVRRLGQNSSTEKALYAGSISKVDMVGFSAGFAHAGECEGKKEK